MSGNPVKLPSRTGHVSVRVMARRKKTSTSTIYRWLEEGVRPEDIESKLIENPGTKPGTNYSPKWDDGREHVPWTMADELRENLRRVLDG